MCYRKHVGHVAELVYAYVSEAYGAILEGSSPSVPTLVRICYTFPMDREERMRRLTPEEYAVTQQKATEAPFSGAYVDEHAHGVYNCKVCGAQLFASGSKFDSGTGWPSFDQALPGAVRMEADSSHGMTRTEVVCAVCGAHLGHVFDDGPAETTGKRFCINSCSLDLEQER